MLVSFPSPSSQQNPVPDPTEPAIDVADCMFSCGTQVSSAMIECSQMSSSDAMPMCYRTAAAVDLQCMGDCFGVGLGDLAGENSTPGN